MPDINEIKSNIMETLGAVADKTRDFAGKAADKAKTYAKTAKLSMEISGERESVKKAYLEIGKLYYDTHKDDPEGFFAQLFEEVSLSLESIAEKEATIAALKAESRGDSDVCCDAECCCEDDECCEVDESSEAECCCEDEGSED